MDGKFQNPLQITKLQNKKKLIEFLDFLKPAPETAYAQIHANGEVGEDGKKQYSRIRINIADYSKGTGDDLRSAIFNLEPETVRWLYEASKNEIQRWNTYKALMPYYEAMEAIAEKVNTAIVGVHYNKAFFSSKERLDAATAPLCGVPEFKPLVYSKDKIFPTGQKDKSGRCPMNRLTITRMPIDAAKGEERKAPWIITIDNGVAVAVSNEMGGSYAKSGSFMSAGGSVTFVATDEDWLSSLGRVVAFIECFETAYCCRAIKNGRVAAQEAYKQRQEKNNDR